MPIHEGCGTTGERKKVSGTVVRFRERKLAKTVPATFSPPKLQGPSAFTLRPSTLAEGKHKLKIICQGKNPASTNTLIGLGYVVLKTI